jgi:hypothetical protein
MTTLDPSQLDRVGSFIVELQQALNGAGCRLELDDDAIWVTVDDARVGHLVVDEFPMEGVEPDETMAVCRLEVGANGS